MSNSLDSEDICKMMKLYIDNIITFSFGLGDVSSVGLLEFRWEQTTLFWLMTISFAQVRMNFWAK